MAVLQADRGKSRILGEVQVSTVEHVNRSATDSLLAQSTFPWRAS